jgi:fructose-bisphosphate aldolase class II
MPERDTEIVEQLAIPQVLHGGTGLSEAQFTDLIARGCAKVNISTALKIAFIDAHREFLEANPTKKDPPSMLRHVRDAVKEMAEEHIRMFGSAGRAATSTRSAA